MAGRIPADYAGYATELDDAVAQRSIKLTYAAFAAAGTRSLLSVAQAQATNRQWLLLGNGTADMTLAIAQGIVAVPTMTPISSAYNTNQANLATGMVTYFTDVPAAADAAYCYGFAVGGLQCSDVYNVVLRNYKRASTAAQNSAMQLINVSGSTLIGGYALTQPGNNAQISLNGSNQILLPDGTTALTYGTNTIVVCPAYGVIFGALQITDVADAAAAGDILELEIYFK